MGIYLCAYERWLKLIIELNWRDEKKKNKTNLNSGIFFNLSVFECHEDGKINDKNADQAIIKKHMKERNTKIEESTNHSGRLHHTN